MKAPNFKLKNQDGKLVSLKDFADNWLVLYFYPKDNTPGCTIQAVDFTAKQKEFNQHGAKIVGISPDSIEKHRKFCDKKQLSITLLADPDKQAMQAYDAWGEKKNFGITYQGVIRSTFLIDPNGKIKAEWRKVRVKGHADEVLNKLIALQAE